MTTFRYPLPEASPPSPWGGLSDEARTSLTRIAMGPSPANQLLTPDGNGAEGLPADVHAWATTDFEATNWYQYPDQFGLDAPTSLQELATLSPNLAPTLSRLYEAKQSLISSNDMTPESLSLGETMHLALIPWQEMRNHLGDFDQWIKTLRDSQGIATNDDYINEHLLGAIKSNQPFYRDPENPTRLLTPTQYLDKKIAEDGAWGVMLAQTSQAAGIERIKGQSPDQMTGDGSQHLELTGHNIDAMGVFEWIALTLQNDPKELSPQDASWLLANRMTVDGGPHVPGGDWYDDQVGSYLNWAGNQFVNVRVRPAVM